jgi:hypothetical protein
MVRMVMSWLSARQRGLSWDPQPRMSMEVCKQFDVFELGLHFTVVSVLALLARQVMSECAEMHVMLDVATLSLVICESDVSCPWQW